MKSKWIVVWRDGDVSLFDVGTGIGEWTAAAVMALRNAADVMLCPAGMSPVGVVWAHGGAA